MATRLRSFLQLNVNTVTVGFLAETILKKELGMIAPDANLDDRQGLQLNNRKWLSNFNKPQAQF